MSNHPSSSPDSRESTPQRERSSHIPAPLWRRIVTTTTLAAAALFQSANPVSTSAERPESGRAASTAKEESDDHEEDLPPELQALREKYWFDQQPMYEKIAEQGIQKFYDSLPDKEKAFFTPEQIEAGHGICACCSDGRIQSYQNDNK